MSQREIAKNYDPKQVEDRIYAFWLRNKYFHGVPNKNKKPYSIVIPPPNVTDRLHIGHAYTNLFQDILIRFKKMQGFETMWMPGTDHAGIATQTVVERYLKNNEGLTRHDLGREKFVERVWEWKEKHGAIIIEQLKKLGFACDWERESFTMSEGLSDAVKEVFIALYEKGLIYKGQRIVNWDPASGTALSDDEVEHREVEGKLYHIRYRIKNSDEFIVVATTRPETLLGDTAVAIAKDDEEKQHFIGKKAIIPFVNREVDFVIDEHVDKDFGSGFVKVTPAHDPNDFEIGQRHNLKMIIVLDRNGKILSACQDVKGSEYRDELSIPESLAGLGRFEARKKILAALEKDGMMEKIEDYTHNVGHSYRSHVPIEPYLSEQWFVKMRPLAEKALAAVRDGRIKLLPEGRWDKTYEHWMTSIRDWCISRQLWWGHRIPIWYSENGEVKASRTDPSTETEKWRQDPDVLDTWFSSQLWPFSTLGWPEKNEDVDYFYPTSTLVTGYEIIFFWVARMIMSGLEFMKDVPFENVYLNGIIRDLQGRKMSKSLGNGIDPLAMIEQYSADAVRYTLMHLSSEGNDINLGEKDFEIGRNFTNKLWNAFRFLTMSLEKQHTENATLENVNKARDNGLLDLADRWVLSRYSETVEVVTQALEQFRFHEAIGALHAFFWREYCDWYLELIKPRLRGDDVVLKNATLSTAAFVMRGIVRMLQPFIPFITEEIWSHIGTELSESIMIAEWPSKEAVFEDKNAEAEMDLMQSAIMAVRNIRGEMNVPPQKNALLLISGADDQAASLLQKNQPWFAQLARVSEMQVGAKLEKPRLAATGVVKSLELFLPLEGLIDIDLEVQRLEKEKARLEKQVGGLRGKLANENFISRAPEHVVEKERSKLYNVELSLEKIEGSLAQLRG